MSCYSLLSFCDMSVAQVQLASSAGPKKAPLYPFLSQPPPQKRRPTQPLPSPPSNAKPTPQLPATPSSSPMLVRRRSATTSAITAWVANIHPGSPAPYSPRRSPSAFSRRPSLTRSIHRRSSITSVRVSSASFLNIQDTPTTASRVAITPSMKDFSPSDFTSMGYTSVFVNLPHTPQLPKEPKRGLKHFRSLTSLKPTRRTRTEPIPPVPSSPLHKKSSASLDPVAVAKSKKSKYSKYHPAPLNNDLALAQLLEGGKIDDHVSRFTKADAKAAGAVKVNGQLVGVGSVWRDGEGGIWRDKDEELEYAHLLSGRGSCFSDGHWIQFGSDGSAVSPLDGMRRGSLSTEDSDLSPRYAMKTETDTPDDLVAFGGALAHTVRVKPGMSVLAIPSRSRRTAKHLRKPEFLLDIFPVPHTPTRAPKSPASPRFAAGSTVAMPPKGKARRRPAPLKLTPPSPAFKCPTNPSDFEIARRGFLDDSFAPTPIAKSPRHVVPARSHTAPVNVSVVTKPSTLHLNVKGILKAMGGRKATVAL
ncbi:hypothetical protein EUX98_g6877 [Antrodiella citrinella]|uniref:Uncharacterized protein n=1 Tax=Antrodiella citrinella TaxID=2447956 RepID=A0A4S4MNR3_9APHY|nr:hypothetical protein EUX98_g6877 [Antrodiella citrinella]